MIVKCFIGVLVQGSMQVGWHSGLFIKNLPKDRIAVNFGYPLEVMAVNENSCLYGAEDVARFNSTNSTLTVLERQRFAKWAACPVGGCGGKAKAFLVGPKNP